MSNPLVRKTAIIGPNEAAQMCGENEEVLTTNQPGDRIRSSLPPPPSGIARNRVLKAPAQTPAAPSSRLSNLAMANSSSLSQARPSAAIRKNFIPSTIASKVVAKTKTTAQIPANLKPRLDCPATATVTAATTTRVSGIASKVGIPKTVGRTPASGSRFNAPLNSRTPSVVSSVSSSTTTTTATKRPSAPSRFESKQQCQTNNVQNTIPDTNTIRKGLAKFSNPMECQRQFQALSLKIRQTCEIVEARDKEIDSLLAQRELSAKVVIGLATTVQYYAAKLKLDQEQDLVSECESLKSRVKELMVNEREHETKLEAIVDDYKNHLQVEHDLKKMLERELEETRVAHSESTKTLKEEHENELNDLNETHSTKVKELEGKIETLEVELESKSKDLTELRKEHELLNHSFSKLEESLTKDKDARVKYAQEKIQQLQKDVESLNSVLEMRSERIHSLEKDSLCLMEVQSELANLKDTNKALNQQLESLNAALDKRREQFENLIVEHEKIRQELKRERKERRRMTMRTEQLEYVLNESCATESNMGFNSSMRDLDSADHIV